MTEVSVPTVKVSSNSPNFTSKNKDKYKKPGFLACAGGFLAGSVLSGIPPIPFAYASFKILDKMGKISELTSDEFDSVTKAIDKTLVDTTLTEKGVKLLRIPTTEEKPKSFLEKLQMLTSPATQTEHGKNSFYTVKKHIEVSPKGIKSFDANTIVMPETKLSLCTFHEMGHAVDANLSKIGKVLLKSRNLMLLSLPIGLIALLKTKKAPGEKSDSGVGRTTDFIKNNAGKLTALTMVPMLIEEAMASVKGIKFAKASGLAPELVAKVVKTNKIAYLTYLGATLGASLGIALGVKVKDAIAHPKKIDKN